MVERRRHKPVRVQEHTIQNFSFGSSQVQTQRSKILSIPDLLYICEELSSRMLRLLLTLFALCVVILHSWEIFL